MGATVFSQTVIGRFKNVSYAYTEAKSESNQENGHQQGYSGDIQTVDGYRLRKDAPRYGTKAFWKWEEKRIDAMDKRECEVVEIKGQVLKTMKGRRWFGRKGVKAYYFFGWGAY